MQTPAIEVSSLFKTYLQKPALNEMDLVIPQGQFFGLLGRNGAGKTTLIHSIMGLVRPDRGTIKIFGEQTGPHRSSSRQWIGFAPQEANVDRFFNVRRTLEFQAGFYGYSRSFAKQKAEELLSKFRLTEKATSPFYKLSGGMQRRVLIARALMSEPKILILDEPTAGVDVEQRYELWDFLKGMNQNGTTIFLTTHYIDEAETLCERVALIDAGQIIEEGSPDELVRRHCEESVEIQVSGHVPATIFEDLENVKIEDSRIFGFASKMGPLLGEILRRLARLDQVRIEDVALKHGSLEEVFVKRTGKKITENQEILQNRI